MSESDYLMRIQALTQLLNELRVQLQAIDQRLIRAEQQLAGRWQSASAS